ncbi:DUF6950 family protein [Geminisphaera colitermitum]|uniref:DUF6950 family protein n=1 Tax=Geminisphaera colitermitum TaxID=1148786 RepID=UPI0001964E43|nr:hypothetical protein [Geminisphaera colitermitum]
MTNERIRPDDWPKRLHEYLAEASGKGFRWGIHDCVHFAAGWLECLGYADVLAGLPGWTTRQTAKQTIRELGGFEVAVSDRLTALGCAEVPPLMAQRGDVCVVVAGEYERQMLGVVDGSGVACLLRQGIAHVPESQISKAWRV